MGCRGQIAVQQGNGRVYLYTHWTGDQVEEVLRSALRRSVGRWDVDEYITRIIFCELVKGDENGLTGYGIGLAQHGDTEYPIPVLNTETQTISFENLCGEERAEITVAEFVEQVTA